MALDVARTVSDDGIEATAGMQPLPVSAFDASRNAWCDVECAKDDFSADTLTCATFNTWFNGPEPALRHRGLLEALERMNPDVVLLQEVTAELADAVLAPEWVRENFRVARSPFGAAGQPAYGLMLLTKMPPSSVVQQPLPTRQGRGLLVAQCRVNGAPLAFATAHFESKTEYAATRGEQLKAAFGALENVRNAVLAGDFNFCSSWPEENGRIDPRYADVWAVLRPAEPGYTLDTDVNRMLADARVDRKQARYDRILLRSEAAPGGWEPVSIELLGIEPVDPQRPGIYPSDHFGLAATFRRRAA